METLICPKCRGAMRTYERSGITVDQCGECRGIFLDRGELERLVDAELRYNAPQQPRHEEKRYDEKKRHDDDGGYEAQRRYDARGSSGQKKKQKSFLETLFD